MYNTKLYIVNNEAAYTSYGGAMSVCNDPSVITEVDFHPSSFAQYFDSHAKLNFLILLSIFASILLIVVVMLLTILVKEIEVSDNKTKLMMHVIAGSRLYGAETEESDLDHRIIYATNYSDYIPDFDPHFGYTPDKSLGKDVATLEVTTFARGLCAGNPNMIELLYAPKENILEGVNPFEDIKSAFLSRKCITKYFGYITSLQGQPISGKNNYKRYVLLEAIITMMEGGEPFIVKDPVYKQIRLGEVHVDLNSLMNKAKSLEKTTDLKDEPDIPLIRERLKEIIRETSTNCY